jgi:hypothetical protein
MATIPGGRVAEEKATDGRDSRSFADLLKELRDETRLLVQQEIALARTEVSEKVSQTARNSSKLAVGGLVAYAGLIFLLLALAFLIEYGLVYAGLAEPNAAWMGAGIVGLVVAIIGTAMAMNAKNNLKQASLVPERTKESLKENKQWIEQKMT